MKITFDKAKRDKTLKERGLDFADAADVFAQSHVTIPDERRNYGEPRFMTFGLLQSRMLTLAWTPRGSSRRIISMRKANEKEQKKYRQRLEEG